MHATAIVEKQRFIVAPTNTDDTEIEATRADDFLGGQIEQTDTMLADDQELTTIVDVLQTEGTIDIL